MNREVPFTSEPPTERAYRTWLDAADRTMARTNGLLLAACLFARPLPLSHGADLYVSPTGTPSGAGTLGSPLDIASVCARGATKARPGDTVWLLGGHYGRDGNGKNSSVECAVAGTEAAPVIVRNHRNQRATLHGGLGVFGAHAWYWGLEVTNNWTRSTDECGSGPSIDVHDGVYFGGGTVHTKCSPCSPPPCPTPLLGHLTPGRRPDPRCSGSSTA
eukprot:COSAG04_NODE_3431_length_2819_cov_2.837132_2_plen_217_part_00